MKKIKDALYAVGSVLPVPNVNPSIVSGLSVVSSMLFVLSVPHSPPLAFAFAALALLLDGFDGLIARKFRRQTEEGYLVDVASDRLSEGLIFSVFFFPWFFLFTANCVLALASIARKRHIILPLRHVFIPVYAFMLLSGQL